MFKVSRPASEETSMGHSRTGVIFDGDDTLWETQPLYLRTKNNFLREMENLGFDPIEVERRFERVDVDNVRLLGFSKARFPKSMTDTYQALCLHFDKPTDELVRSRIEAIGYSVFGKKPGLFDGVPEVLRILHNQQLKLILATKGDQEVQEDKISRSDLLRYFHRIYIFREKGQRELHRIADECGLDVRRSWSIGNSIKSDINPALKIGMKAIWIQNKAWDFEEEEPFETRGLFKVTSIKEVPGIVASRIPRLSK